MNLETGFGKYLSVGAALRVQVSSEDLPVVQTPFPLPDLGSDGPNIGFSIRADFHTQHLFGLEKSDILVGYNYQGVSGVNLEYRHYFNDAFAGIYKW